MKRLRIAARLVALAAALLGALLLHGLWHIGRRPSPWPRRFLAGAARIVGARAHVVGTPAAGRVVFLANHLSWIDILLLAGATGTAFVAKAELRRAPLVGWLATLNRTVFVARSERLGVGTQIATLRAALARPGAVTLFPEGTTGDGMTLLPFKAALFAALDPPPAGVAIQPVRIDYGPATPALAWCGRESGRDHALRVLARRGRFDATLRFLAPVDPVATPGRKAIAAAARARIEAAGESGPAPV